MALSMSGGQRKLLEMARALMSAPQLVMLDEPMAGVNPALTQSLLGHIVRLKEQGMSVVFVEHDMHMVQAIADWVVVMAEGRIVAEGVPAEVMRDQVVVDAYLGANMDRDLHEVVQDIRAEYAASHPTEGTSMSEHVLETIDLVAGYVPGVDILNGTNSFVDKGELVGIIGPNGAGKSTLLKAIFGLVSIRSGAVVLNGEDITGLRANKLVTKGVGFVPQTENVFEALTIAENLEMGCYQRPELLDTRLEFVIDLFPELKKRLGQKAGSLSGGERQMVAMSRALMMDPHVLLLDEPSAGLSPVRQDETFINVARINAAGVSVMMVEQNARRCLQICDRAYVLDMGRDAYVGTGRDLLEDPKVIHLYLGTLAEDHHAG
jgi:amino acid/amide ABC transporter ATP-binding protein 2, HAAT family (TC 3.A.1.4.-)